VNTRNVIDYSHLPDCPICQGVIDLDHSAAIEEDESRSVLATFVTYDPDATLPTAFTHPTHTLQPEPSAFVLVPDKEIP
jgi:hypothetical protein